MSRLTRLLRRAERAAFPEVPLKLGAHVGVRDPRTFRLRDYTAKMATPPAAVHRSREVHHWPMFENDRYGCCVFASAGHATLGWAAEGHRKVTLGDQDILAAYSAVTGFRPDDPSTDNGTDPTAALSYWRGTGIAGNTVAAYASVSPTDALTVKRSIWLFGGLWLALNLPASARDQVSGHPRLAWDVPPEGTGAGTPGEPGSWGGHMVFCVGYDRNYVALVTWGSIQLMTWRFLGTYGDLGYALLDETMLDAKSGRSPQGLDLKTLDADLAALSG